MRSSIVYVALVPAAMLMSALPRSSGALPGVIAPIDACRQSPSCTSCHTGVIGQSGVSTLLTAPSHSLALNESIQLSLQVTGGPNSTQGGFAAENTAGAFTAGINTQVNTSGRPGQFITHTTDTARSWTIPYTAPGTPGLVKIYAVANAVDGGGSNGDSIAFNGFDPMSLLCTPVYLGVNAIGNQRFGNACVGGYGNWPVLYSDLVPSVGNGNYAVRLAGVAPSAPALFLVGSPLPGPVALDAIGLTGCELLVSSNVTVLASTTAGNAERAEGTAQLGLPIPSASALLGATVAVQAAVVDAASGRFPALTVTGGLLITIQ